MQMIGDKVKDFLIPEPAGCLAMDLQRTRLEEQQVAAIFQGRHVVVERLPIIANQDDSAGGGELSGDTALAQGRSRRLPGYRLGPFRLAQSFEETNPQAVSIETVDVVQRDGLIPVLVSLQVNTKGCLKSNQASKSQSLPSAPLLSPVGDGRDRQQVPELNWVPAFQG